MGIIMREWYTDREWERIVGWGKLPKEYQKPEYIHEEFDYKKKNQLESWDMFLVRKLRERRQYEETINERHGTNKVQRWYSKIFKWGRRK